MWTSSKDLGRQLKDAVPKRVVRGGLTTFVDISRRIDYLNKSFWWEMQKRVPEQRFEGFYRRILCGC